MNILYITSFNQEIYEASGVNLLRSFIQNDNKNTIFIGYEGASFAANGLKFIAYNLVNDSYLNDWLKENADIIPKYLGGLASPCSCRDPFERKESRHRKACRFNWWNRNCSRWFRKIACLNAIINSVIIHQKFDAFVWLDADCQFLKPIPDNIFVDIFANNDVFYMRGRTRRAIESGILGFRNNKLGLKYIEDVIKVYANKRFRQYPRWDDGYIFKLVTGITCWDIKFLDLAIGCHSTEVAEYTVLTQYIKHFKGRHGRGLNIMK